MKRLAIEKKLKEICKVERVDFNGMIFKITDFILELEINKEFKIKDLGKIERHIMLYAQGWYKETELIGDLTTILSTCLNFNWHEVSIDNIYHFVCKTFLETVDKRISDSLVYELFEWCNGEITRIKMIEKMMSNLREVKCREDGKVIFDLGVVDDKVLPCEHSKEDVEKISS